MLTNSLLTDMTRLRPSRRSSAIVATAAHRSRQSAHSSRQQTSRARSLGARAPYDRRVFDLADHIVEVSSPDVVTRRTVISDGMAAEIVEVTSHDRFEFRFRAPVHLLVVHEQGARRDGDTFVEGLSRSTLRDFSRKLTFVPAGHEYREWQEPRTPAVSCMSISIPPNCRLLVRRGRRSGYRGCVVRSAAVLRGRNAPGHGPQAEAIAREPRRRKASSTWKPSASCSSTS